MNDPSEYSIQVLGLNHSGARTGAKARLPGPR